jgi:hypothetical protein
MSIFTSVENTTSSARKLEDGTRTTKNCKAEMAEGKTTNGGKLQKGSLIG